MTKPMRLAVLVVLLALPVALPAAQAATFGEVQSLDLAPGVAEITLRARYSGEAAVVLRSRIDLEHGDGNGRVSNEEVQAFAQAFERSRDRSRSCLEALKWLWLDGKGPMELDHAWLSLDGAAGDSFESFDLQETSRFRFVYPEPGPAATAVVGVGAWRPETLGMFCLSDGGPADWPFQATWEDRGAPPRIEIHSTSHRLLLETPSSGAGVWDGAGVVAESNEARAALRESVFQFRVMPFTGPLASETVPGPADGSFALVLLVACASFGFLVWRSEGFARLLWPFVGFARVAKERVTDNPRRARLVEIVTQNPGVSLADLKRATGFSNGNLLHHLRVLERAGQVRLWREGFRVRAAAPGQCRTPGPYLTEYQRRILDTIQGQPGSTQTQLVVALQAPRDLLSYHLRRLERIGLVGVQRDGRWRRYFVAARPGPEERVPPLS